MFKKLLPLTFVAAIVIVSCKKNNNSGCPYSFANVTAPATEVTALQDSIQTHGIHGYDSDPSGFFYQTISMGTSDTTATGPCSVISVNYKAYLINGTVFDSTKNNTPASFALGGLIPGWQKSIPLIKSGGEIVIYLPPSLAYGSTPFRDSLGNIIAPANSNIAFDIKLLAVQN